MNPKLILNPIHVGALLSHEVPLHFLIIFIAIAIFRHFPPSIIKRDWRVVVPVTLLGLSSLFSPPFIGVVTASLSFIYLGAVFGHAAQDFAKMPWKVFGWAQLFLPIISSLWLTSLFRMGFHFHWIDIDKPIVYLWALLANWTWSSLILVPAYFIAARVLAPLLNAASRLTARPRR